VISIRSVVAAALLTLSCSGWLAAQNPTDADALAANPEAVRTGMGIFRLRCADCHGVDGRGVRGPDLTQVWAAGRTADGLFRTITNGIPGTTMRPLERIREPEVWQLIAYLRSIAAPPAPPVARGDAERGETLFVSYCAVCHQVDAVGGRLGPDLSRIGVARSPATIINKIRGNDGRAADPDYVPITLTTATGELIQGIKRNEDLFSIQIIGLDGRIQGFEKDDLESLEIGTASLMPIFSDDVIDTEALDDLLSYMLTLRGFDPTVH
jgi:putative heme-binding domain-containing protein